MRYKRIAIFAVVIVGIVAIFLQIKSRVTRGVSFYDNGNLKHEVMLKDGKPEGLAITYFESGKIRSRVYWHNGLRHGIGIIYNENGTKQQENRYKNGICIESKDYTNNELLKQVTYFDSQGRIFDYHKYDAGGARDFNREAKNPILIPHLDTLILGESYSTDIRLGNRQFDYIEVVIGNIEDEYIAKKNPPLAKKDSLTSVLTIKADSLGSQKISGIVIERSAKSDSLDVIPFTYRFYVIPSPKK